MRPARLLAIAFSLLLACTLVDAPAAHAVLTESTDSSINRSRVFKAYQRDSGTIFEVNFTTVIPNEKRQIGGRLDISMPASASDDVLVGTYTIYCAPAGSNAGNNKILGSQNVLRGKSMSFRPRYIFTATVPGNYHCWMRLVSGRPRPSGVRTSSNIFTVGSKSYLRATAPASPAADHGFTPTSPSKVLSGGSAYDAAVLEWHAPPIDDSVAVTGDAWLTSCTAVEGSTDPVTGKRLCEGKVNKSGSRVLTRVVVAQRETVGSGYCRVTTVRARTTYISKDVHHRMIFASGSVPISTAPECSRSFRIKVYVKHVGGSAVVIHNQGTISTLLPRGFLNG